MKVRAILNPRAGLAAARARDALLRGPWPDLDLIETRAPGHARALAGEAAAAGCDLVVAAGGDGTANEVAWGLLGSSAAFGLVPLGSGNGLARTLRIPLGARRAVAALASGVMRAMDVGRIDGRPFLNVAGAGLDAVVGADFQAHGHAGGRRGVLTYVKLSLPRALRYEAPAWRLEAGDERFEGRALIVCFANGRQYGGGAVIAPGARLDDGLLDIVVFEDAGALEILANAPRLFLGTIERFRRYRHLRAAAAVLEGPSGFLHHRDGEPEPEAIRVEVRLEPRALRILVPRETAEDGDGPFLPAPA
ncbi:MAG TPA: diacylglycerol kinase family protein [Vicinamibacteria bacterium]|nr:diacylglycerol kinase family protein [Vicinamibacteria bacterium]